VSGRIERNPFGERDEDPGEHAPNRGLSKKEAEKQAAARLEEIHQYLADRYARREVVSRTATKGGLELDWVPIESQLHEDKLADPPEEDRPLEVAGEKRRAELMRFELEVEGAERGPEGTIPMVRKRIERIRPVVGLNDWLAKGIRAHQLTAADDPRQIALPQDGGTHKYANTGQSVTAYGTEGNINAWDPYVEWSDEFSLGQLGLSRGSGNGFQTVEVGHQEYRDLYGDWVPHLFVFYTTNNYTDQGDNKGGYNQDVDGWVQYSNTIHPEALSSPLSQFGGTQYIMALKVQLWQGNWWVRVNGNWIGYYPASLYSTGGLRSQASSVGWWGEIVDSDDHAGTSRTDMGNGHWPYEGWQHCAYMNNLRYQSGTGGAMSTYSAGASASHPNCYGVEGHFNNTGSWGSYFWWGGSGKNSQCP
jgi:Neprosin